MFPSRARRSLGLLVLFLVGAIPAAAQGAAGRTVDARQLLAIAKGGLTAAAAAAGPAEGPLAPMPAVPAKNRPFWAAVDAMGRALDTVEAAFLARDPAFFAALGNGSRTLAELKAVWAHSAPATASARTAGVTSGLETLSAAYLLLRGSYGWEALRRQQGGALTADEERRLQALKRAQAVLANRLTALRTQAARAGDPRTAADLDRLLAQARSLAAAQLTLESYLAALQSAEALQGEWTGAARYAKPAVRKALKKAAPLVEDLTTDPGVGFVFTTDLSKADSWAPLETPVEVPAGVDLGPEVATIPAVDPAAAPVGATEAADAGDAEPLLLDPAPSDTAAETPPAMDAKAGKEHGDDPQPAPEGKPEPAPVPAPTPAAPSSPSAQPALPAPESPAPAPPPSS